MNTATSYLVNFLGDTWQGVLNFASTPFAEQPAAWLAAWAGCLAAGALIGWGIVAED